MARTLLVALCCAYPAWASAGLINGDFETGDLTGWDTSYSAGSVATLGVEPAPGGGSWGVLRVETTAGTEEVGAILSQTFTLAGRSDFSFDVAWSLTGEVSAVFLLAVVDGAPSIGGVQADLVYPELGTGTDAGATTISGRLEAGTYTLLVKSGVLLQGAGPGVTDAWMAIDHVTAVLVPEPAAALLLLLGALSHWGFRRATRGGKSARCGR